MIYKFTRVQIWITATSGVINGSAKGRHTPLRLLCTVVHLIRTCAPQILRQALFASLYTGNPTALYPQTFGGLVNCYYRA
jgi:hypothetical protein